MKKINFNKTLVFYLLALILFSFQFYGIFWHLLNIIDFQNLGPKDIIVNPVYIVDYLPQLIYLPLYCFLVFQLAFWFAGTILKAGAGWFKRILIMLLLFFIVDFLFLQIFIDGYMLAYQAQWGGSNIDLNYGNIFKMALGNFSHWRVVLRAYLLGYWPMIILFVLAVYFKLRGILVPAEDSLKKINRFLYILWTVAVILVLGFLTYNFDPNSKFHTLLPPHNRVVVDRVGLIEVRQVVDYPVYYPNKLPAGYIQETIMKKASKYDSILTGFVNRKYKINILYSQVNSKTSKIVQKYATAVEYLEDKKLEYKKEQYKNYDLYFYKVPSADFSYRNFNNVIFDTADGITHNILITDFNDGDQHDLLINFIDSLSIK